MYDTGHALHADSERFLVAKSSSKLQLLQLCSALDSVQCYYQQSLDFFHSNDKEKYFGLHSYEQAHTNTHNSDNILFLKIHNEMFFSLNLMTW